MAGTQMQQRRDTAAQWTANNRVLAAGELGIETDTRLIKVGNGTSAWNGLPYLNYYPLGSKVADSELLDGFNSTEFLLKTEAVNAYLAKNGKAADAELLDGLDSSKLLLNDTAAAMYDRVSPISGPTPSATPSPTPALNQKYFDTTLNELLAWNGTRWYKVGGRARFITGTNAMGSSGQIPIQSKTSVRSINVPAHTAGDLRLVASGVWTADVGQAITAELLWAGSTGTTTVTGSAQRTHNGKAGAVASTTPFHCEAFFNSIGSAFTLGLAVTAEANTPTFVIDGSFNVWLGSQPL